MKDILAIVGSHPRTRKDFDFSRAECDVWLFNEAVSSKINTWAKRADAVFQMHIPTIWKNPNNRNDAGHYDWLCNQTDVPTIYMQDVYPEVPASVRYPITEIRAMLGGDPDHFLSSSVPQAIALGVWLGYKRIEVYGVAMESNTEYQWQREGVAFWRGFAMGRGIDFYFADPTYRCPLYGYEGNVTIDYERFTNRIAELEPQIKKLADEFTAHKSKLFARLGAFCEDGNGKNEKELFETVASVKQYTDMLGRLDGAIQENERYKKRADTMKQAADDFIFSRQEFESAGGAQREAIQQAEQDITVIGSHLDMLHAAIKSAAKGSPKRIKTHQAYAQKLQAYMEAINKCGLLHGALGENYIYMTELDKSIRAAGGQKSLEVITGV